jgi:hypothetical protein
VVVEVVVVAAELEAALITVAPTAPPAIDPTASSATIPRRLRSMDSPFVVGALERLAAIEEHRRAGVSLV